MKLSLKSTLVSVLFLATIGSGQLHAQLLEELPNPFNVCPNVSYTFDLGSVPIRTSWSVVGGTITQRSGGLWTSQTITVTFTSSGSVTINEYEQGESEDSQPPWVFDDTYTLNVNVYSPGTILGSSMVCPANNFQPSSVTNFVLTDGSAFGSSFVWQSSISGQDPWSSASSSGPATSLTTSITQNTYFRVASNDCSGLYSTPYLVTALPLQASAPTVGGTDGFAGTLQLTASGASDGGRYLWYTATSSYGVYSGNVWPQNVSTSAAPYGYASIINSSGCEGPKNSFNVNIFPNPVISAPQNYVAKGATVMLSTGAQYSKYLWTNSTGGVVGGDASSCPVTTPDTYTVTVTYYGSIGTSSYTLLAPLSGQNVNSIIVNTSTTKNLKDPSLLDVLPVDQVNQRISYFDGLGRVVQTIDTEGSPGKNDLIIPTVYDNMGRENKKYLPVSGENSGKFKEGLLDANGNYTGIAQNYSNGTTDKITDDTRPYSETIFEPSPLNRPAQQFGPGQNWKANNKNVSSRYLLNQSNEVVLFSYDAATQLISATSNSQTQYYGANQLQSNGTTDENGNDVITYIDKLGHTVCKKVQYSTDGVGNKLYASTYYIYDNLGNLAVVLPPEATRNFDLK